MNTESKELRLMAYLDNEVSASEGRQIAAWLARDAEARALYDELKATRDLVRENEPAMAVPETREFYWSQISRRIATAEREGAPVEAAPRNWILRFLAPAAALAAVVMFAVTSLNTGPNRQLVDGATALAQVENSATDNSISFYSPEHKMTVVWIDSGKQETVAEAEFDFDDFE